MSDFTTTAQPHFNVDPANAQWAPLIKCHVELACDAHYANGEGFDPDSRFQTESMPALVDHWVKQMTDLGWATSYRQAQRLVAQHGLAILFAEAALRRLTNRPSPQAFSSPTIYDLIRRRGTRYVFEDESLRYLTTGRARNWYLLPGSHIDLARLALILSLSKATILNIALIASLRTSLETLDKASLRVFESEWRLFVDWIGRRLERP